MNPLFIIPAAFGGFIVGRFMRGWKRSHSPVPGVPFRAWERFVTVMVVAPKTHISPRGKLGTFQMDARRLKDVGVVKNAKKGMHGEEVGVWVGEWVAPLTKDAFLGSMPLQYAAFVRSMKAAAPKVSGFVGVDVDGATCSLSGLLGVAHAAGEAGVESWVENSEVRRRFAGTTDVFRRTNQIF